MVFVTYMNWLDVQRAENPLELEDVRPLRGATRLVRSLGVAAPLRKGA